MPIIPSGRPERVKSRKAHPVHRWVVVCAAAAAFALLAIASIAPPPPPSIAAELRAYEMNHAQTFTVNGALTGSSVDRDSYSATPGFEALAVSATNEDWAKLVLLDGNWPITTNNVTVMLRWMRQENGPPNWWNRNNPLNNGLGSGGHAGTGSYANLMIAAQKAAENLHRPIFATISDAFYHATSTTTIEHAIWASAWSTSHYANGAHWSSTPVPSVRAPVSAW
jgi:hypothetical protein